ncbi:MAG: anti-sigma factor [Chloroflexi bacterium]|nr:anti-sigma factor [Chloroflexota bacterium]
MDDVLPAYALGVASGDERREVEAHLATCDKHPQLAEYRETVGLLSMSAPTKQPAGAVKQRLMARVYQDLEPQIVRPPWWQHAWTWAAAAAVALLALGVGIRDWAVSAQGGATTWQLAPTAAGIQAAGTLVWLPSQQTATLTMQHLPPLAAGNLYEVWLIKNGQPAPAGVFQPGSDASASVILKGDPQGYQTVAVTEEPGPQGSAAPTHQPFLTGRL